MDESNSDENTQNRVELLAIYYHLIRKIPLLGDLLW
jgi:hypothetical protein